MGNKRVVADSSRCIGCQTCMAACIEAHDIPGNIAAPRLRDAHLRDFRTGGVPSLRGRSMRQGLPHGSLVL